MAHDEYSYNDVGLQIDRHLYGHGNSLNSAGVYRLPVGLVNLCTFLYKTVRTCTFKSYFPHYSSGSHFK